MEMVLTNKCRSLAVLIALAGATLVGTPARSAPTAAGGKFTIVDAPKVQGVTTLLGINDKGQAVGWYRDLQADVVRSLLLDHGVFTRLVSVPPEALAWGINNKGQVVGYLPDSGGDYHGFLITHGVSTKIDAPTGHETRALAVNDSGRVVGTFLDAQQIRHGFLWDGVALTTVDVPKALLSPSKAPSGTSADGINSRGDIVGYYGDEHNAHGFLLRAGVFTTLDAPFGARSTSACGINDAGDVVGHYTDKGGETHGFLLRAGVYTKIDPPHAKNIVICNSINKQGQIVGYYLDTAFHCHGFLYSP